MFTQSIIYLFILFINSQSSSQLDYKREFFYCNNRIYCDNNNLSIDELNSLCQKITSDDRYTILFTNRDTFFDENSYIKNSEKFFKNYCPYTAIDCKYSFAISIYLNGGKVIITSGSISKNIVTQSYRMNIINNMINYLKNSRYYQAISYAVSQLTDLYFRLGGRTGGGTYTQEEHSTFVIFFFVLILLCCCFCCYFIYRNQKKSNDELTYTQIIENRDHQDNSYDQSLKIHNHLVALENIIKEINYSNPPIKNTNLCLICMQPIINTVGIVETANTRFLCQHVYHTDCLSRFNLKCCLMCKDINNNDATTVINNLYDTQVINEEQVKNFIKNLQNIYPPQQLKVYAQTYPQEYNNFNDGLMLGLLASSWCAPPVVVVNQGYYGGYNNYGDYNPPNMYNNNPNPDSAIGGFQNNNIEMNDMNNDQGNFGNNQNTTGNFGNNQNTYGNFGNSGNNVNDVGSYGNDGDFGCDGGDF